jgi:Icc protein
VFAVPGNHDTTEVITDVFGKPEADFGDWRMVGVATNIPGQVPGTAAPVVAALDTLDATDPDRPAVVLTHHPLRSPSTHEWFTLAGADVLEQRLLRRAAPVVVLSGHTHQPYETRVGAAQLLGAPSTYYGIRHDGDSWSEDFDLTGARIIDLHDDGSVATHVVTC